MKRTVKLTLIITVIVLIICAVIYISYSYKNDDTAISENQTTLYNTNEEVSNAILRLSSNDTEASVITGTDTVENVAAITFEGMLDNETANQILALLDKYDMSATFFFPGIKAAEDPDTVKAVVDSGHTLGNYTLSAEQGMEQYDNETLVKNFTRTNVILKQITGTAPTMLKCNLTEYTDELLNAAYASNLNYAVESNYFLNYQSFRTQQNADDYVKKLQKGSIISFKTDSYLDKSEYEKGRTTTAETTSSTTAPISSATSADSKGTTLNLIENIEYLLKALKAQEYEIVSLSGLEAYDDEDFSMNFTEGRAKNDGKLAEVCKRVTTSSASVAYSFRGIEDEEMLDKVLKLLDNNGNKATFFVTGSDIIRYPDRIKKILSAGHTIGNGGMSGLSVDKMSFREVCFEIYKCGKLLKDNFNIDTTMFMPVYGKYSDIVLEAASTLNYSVVTYSKLPITDNTADVSKIMEYFNKSIRNGDIINFRLDYYDKLDEVLTLTSKKIKESGKTIVSIDTLINNISLYSIESKPESEAITVKDSTTIKNSTGTVKVNTVNGDYKSMLTKNASVKAEQVKNIYTTQPSVSYIFRAISNKTVLDGVLTTLDSLNAKATFFVTAKEITKYPENIEAILAHGHQICNAGYGMDSKDPTQMSIEDMCYEIDMGERYLKAYLGDRYNETTDKFYMPLYANANDELLEAASAMGYKKVITYSKNAMLSAYKNLSADQIISKYYKNINSLQRGDVVYFRLDYLTQPNAIQDLIYKTAVQYINTVPYNITTIGDMMSSPLVYTPISRAQAMSESSIEKSYNYSEEKLSTQIFTHYIGNPSINDSSTLLGFNNSEISKINTDGKIDTNGEKVLFLTFDDWGNDANITHLLNVLKKYNVKSTFFVRVGTENTPYDSSFNNPNLLRAIALDGHDIGSHTFTHMTINIETSAMQQKLQQDLESAYDEMYRYIGDTGRLQLYFRPPTLAVSKLGMETVFNCGHNYIVNGDFSTHDYSAESVENLVYKLLNGFDTTTDKIRTNKTRTEDMRYIGSGSVIVMHMSDNAQYTADALDTVIPFYMSLGYRFAKLSDYLK